MGTRTPVVMQPVLPNTITRRAPGKINRCLHILNRREDGYHNIQSLFQAIEYFDDLTFECLPGTTSITLTGMDAFGGNNLILKAARLLQAHTQAPGARIQITKRLPMGAGLGGGSSNAACTLMGLNDVWNLNLPRSQLLKLGASLGADVPFFLSGESAAWVEGIGDHLTPVKIDRNERIILICPDYPISTASIFRHPDLPRNHKPIRTPNPGELINPNKHTGNHCTALVRKLHPTLNTIFQELEEHFEHCSPQLTGTGSSVFVPIDQHTHTQQQTADLLEFIKITWPSYGVW